MKSNIKEKYLIKKKRKGMLGFTVPHEFLIQHGSIACASCCSFCLVAWFTQRKGNETKVCIPSDVCMSVRTARSGRESSARMPANARASDWISVAQPNSSARSPLQQPSSPPPRFVSGDGSPWRRRPARPPPRPLVAAPPRVRRGLLRGALRRYCTHASLTAPRSSPLWRFPISPSLPSCYL